MAKYNFRSDFEIDIANELDDKGIAFEYEHLRIPYQRKPSKYLVDIELPNGIFLEIKGLFTGSDRTKHLLIKKQHPDLDIRFIFQRAKNKLNKKSKTTYGDWCDKHGFKWAEGHVPDEWLEEQGPSVSYP